MTIKADLVLCCPFLSPSLYILCVLLVCGAHSLGLTVPLIFHDLPLTHFTVGSNLFRFISQQSDSKFVDYGPVAKRGLDDANPVSKTWYPNVQRKW